MSETQTSHEPTPDELARESPDPAHHPGDIPGEPHGAGDHGDTDGHADHAHAAEALGPVDVRAWGALVLGVAAGLLVALCLVITTTLLAPAVA